MPKSQSGQKEPSCSPSSNRRLTERENRIFFAPEVVQRTYQNPGVLFHSLRDRFSATNVGRERKTTVR
jgi:hypothetical protein